MVEQDCAEQIETQCQVFRTLCNPHWKKESMQNKANRSRDIRWIGHCCACAIGMVVISGR